MTEKKSPTVDNDLTSYIYDTISRLERLASRLEAFAEIQERSHEPDAANSTKRRRNAPKPEKARRS